MKSLSSQFFEYSAIFYDADVRSRTLTVQSTSTSYEISGNKAKASLIVALIHFRLELVSKWVFINRKGWDGAFASLTDVDDPISVELATEESKIFFA